MNVSMLILCFGVIGIWVSFFSNHPSVGIISMNQSLILFAIGVVIANLEEIRKKL